MDEVLSAVRTRRIHLRSFCPTDEWAFRRRRILFIDSAYQTSYGDLKSNYFVRLIEESEHIAEVISEKEELFDEKGFGLPIEASKHDAANLILHP